jgi:hypothetical protein
MNQSLFLAAKILDVLAGSGQSFEGQLVATKIVCEILRAEPYGSLDRVNPDLAESSEAASPSLDT